MTISQSEPRPITWPDTAPTGCPFPQSSRFRGLTFTGRYATYLHCAPRCVDFFMPSWAADDNLYSGCGDGKWDGADVHAGLVQIAGDDPLDLRFSLLGDLTLRTPGQMFNCTNLIHGGRWFVGLEEGWNWSSAAGMARFWGFVHTATPDRVIGRIGYPFEEGWGWTDATVSNPSRTWWNKYWDDATMQGRRLPIGRPGYPSNMPLERPGGFFADIPYNSRFRGPHFVDFGQDGKRETSDGMVYMTAHGSVGPRPSEWGNGDSIYLLRAPATLAGITDPKHWQGWTGAAGGWSTDLSGVAPIAHWKGRLGRCAMTWNAALSRYLLCVAPLVRRDTDDPKNPKEHLAEGVMILESEAMTGPWRLIHHLEDFGPNAYCLNVPTKFIAKDGITFWLLYSSRWGVDAHVPSNPPGSAYGACFCQVQLNPQRAANE